MNITCQYSVQPPPNGITGIRIKIQILFSLLILTLTGCTPSESELALADYGLPPNKEIVKREIQSFWYSNLIDPTSAMYSWGEPRKAWSGKWGNFKYGWQMDYRLNAKNSFGGYVGWQEYRAFYQNGQMTEMLQQVGDYYLPIARWE